MEDIFTLKPSDLGTFWVKGHRAKDKTLWEIERLCGFAMLPNGKIICPTYQRVYTCDYIVDAQIICNAYNAKFSRYCNAIAVTKCHGNTKVIYLANLVDPITPSRIRHENITRFFGFTPIDDINNTRNAVRFFVDFDLYLDYINGK